MPYDFLKDLYQRLSQAKTQYDKSIDANKATSLDMELMLSRLNNVIRSTETYTQLNYENQILPESSLETVTNAYLDYAKGCEEFFAQGNIPAELNDVIVELRESIRPVKYYGEKLSEMKNNPQNAKPLKQVFEDKGWIKGMFKKDPHYDAYGGPSTTKWDVKNHTIAESLTKYKEIMSTMPQKMEQHIKDVTGDSSQAWKSMEVKLALMQGAIDEKKGPDTKVNLKKHTDRHKELMKLYAPENIKELDETTIYNSGSVDHAILRIYDESTESGDIESSGIDLETAKLINDEMHLLNFKAKNLGFTPEEMEAIDEFADMPILCGQIYSEVMNKMEELASGNKAAIDLKNKLKEINDATVKYINGSSELAPTEKMFIEYFDCIDNYLRSEPILDKDSGELRRTPDWLIKSAEQLCTYVPGLDEKYEALHQSFVEKQTSEFRALMQDMPKQDVPFEFAAHSAGTASKLINDGGIDKIEGQKAYVKLLLSSDEYSKKQYKSAADALDYYVKNGKPKYSNGFGAENIFNAKDGKTETPAERMEALKKSLVVNTLVADKLIANDEASVGKLLSDLDNNKFLSELVKSEPKDLKTFLEDPNRTSYLKYAYPSEADPYKNLADRLNSGVDKSYKKSSPQFRKMRTSFEELGTLPENERTDKLFDLRSKAEQYLNYKIPKDGNLEKLNDYERGRVNFAKDVLGYTTVQLENTIGKDAIKAHDLKESGFELIETPAEKLDRKINEEKKTLANFVTRQKTDAPAREQKAFADTFASYVSKLAIKHAIEKSNPDADILETLVSDKVLNEASGKFAETDFIPNLLSDLVKEGTDFTKLNDGEIFKKYAAAERKSAETALKEKQKKNNQITHDSDNVITNTDNQPKLM